MSDFFKGELDKENVIDTNKQICKQSNEEFGLDHPEKLDEIISNIRGIERIEDEKEKVIRKISILMVLVHSSDQITKMHHILRYCNLDG